MLPSQIPNEMRTCFHHKGTIVCHGTRYEYSYIYIYLYIISIISWMGAGDSVALALECVSCEYLMIRSCSCVGERVRVNVFVLYYGSTRTMRTQNSGTHHWYFVSHTLLHFCPDQKMYWHCLPASPCRTLLMSAWDMLEAHQSFEPQPQHIMYARFIRNYDLSADLCE